jgi:UDP-glucose 6-dehydrogenase
MPEREPIGVIGAGWVGLVTAACFAELGHEVHCRDIVPEKVESLSRGEVPIYEPGLPDLLERNRPRLHFTTEMGDVLSSAQLVFCCVDTPPTYSGDADLSRVETVVRDIGDSRDHAIVMKSTVPVGTGRAIRRERDDLGYVSNPEFLKEGTAVDDFLRPDRVVVGEDLADSQPGFADRVAVLYEPLDAPIIRTDVASAEMIKLASNAFLATKISFINEIANVSEELGADVAEVARGMGLDDRIGPRFLQAGIGYGGSCLVGEETVLVRRQGATSLSTLGALFDEVATERGLDPSDAALVQPDDLEVLSWRAGMDTVEFMRVSCLTRRDYSGEILEVRTEMGRRLRCTPDHPFVVGDASLGAPTVKLALELTDDDWLPIAGGAPRSSKEHAHVLRPPTERLSDGSRDAEVVVMPRPTMALAGDRHGDDGVAWVRGVALRAEQFQGDVYSLEVPESHSFVTSGSIICHNCFPKDVSALKQLAGNTGYHFQLLTAVIEVNELQKRRTIGKLQKHLGSLVGKEIALLGVAFKPNTDDVREATSLVLAARLQSEGANVRVYDPVANERATELLVGARVCDSALEALDGADGAVLVTEWPEFRELDWNGGVRERMANPLVVDGRNFLDGGLLKAAGYKYEGIGRS